MVSTTAIYIYTTKIKLSVEQNFFCWGYESHMTDIYFVATTQLLLCYSNMNVCVHLTIHFVVYTDGDIKLLCLFEMLF